MSANPFEEFVEECGLAELSGESPRTWKRRRDQRTGPPYVKVGRKILYRKAAVSAWLLAREQVQVRGGGVR